MAITAGLDHATGDAFIFMDSDLQDPPEVCYELIQAWEEGYDVAYAKRRSRQDGFLKKQTAYWFYRLLRTFADIDIPEDTGDFRLISKQVADT
jgi:dolichol-phosphate mannosyltransferase